VLKNVGVENVAPDDKGFGGLKPWNISPSVFFSHRYPGVPSSYPNLCLGSAVASQVHNLVGARVHTAQCSRGSV